MTICLVLKKSLCPVEVFGTTFLFNPMLLVFCSAGRLQSPCQANLSLKKERKRKKEDNSSVVQFYSVIKTTRIKLQIFLEKEQIQSNEGAGHKMGIKNE